MTKQVQLVLDGRGRAPCSSIDTQDVLAVDGREVVRVVQPPLQQSTGRRHKGVALRDLRQKRAWRQDGADHLKEIRGRRGGRALEAVASHGSSLLIGPAGPRVERMLGLPASKERDLAAE